ncbi:MAG TPA: carbohydrate porin [Candidatus Binataceae bacterium]|jgi:porin|nr:carbohydrate porin [Candidatus Binataceae bacterium]
MNPARVGILCLVLILAMCGVLRAQDEGPWWTWSTIDGDWGGYRNMLADRGLVFSGTTVIDLQGNVSGGEHRAFACADASLLAVDADLKTIAGLTGTLFHAEFVSNVGQNLSTKSLGNVLQVATAFAQPGYYLGQIYAQQKAFNDVFILQAGRMTTANNFGSLPVFSNYMAFTDNPIPISLTNNTIYFTSLSAVEWALVGTVAPTESVALAVGVYNTNLPSGLPFALQHGLDFSFNGSGGPMEAGQFTYNLNRGRDDTGLPGTYYVGWFYSGADYQVLSGEGYRKGDYGVYFEAQQMIYRYGGAGSDIGLTPWIALNYNPQQSINQLPLLVMAGAVYHGLIRGRADDNAALGFYYGKLSPATASSSVEKVLELAYTWWGMTWLSITPDFQYVFNPGGSGSNRNAAVIGAQFQVLF